MSHLKTNQCVNISTSPLVSVGRQKTFNNIHNQISAQNSNKGPRIFRNKPAFYLLIIGNFAQ